MRFNLGSKAWRRRGLRSIGVTVAAVALLAGGTTTAALAAPAPSGQLSAAEVAVDWFPFPGIDSTWHCGRTAERPAWYEQMCVIVNGQAYQAAYIVKAKSDINIMVGVQNVRNGAFLDYTHCSGFIGAGVRKVCFSPTQIAIRGDYVQGIGFRVLEDRRYSPTIQVS